MARSFDRSPLAFSANAYHDLLRRHCGGGAGGLLAFSRHEKGRTGAAAPVHHFNIVSHSALIFASFIIGNNLSASDLCSVASASGVSMSAGNISCPISAK